MIEPSAFDILGIGAFGFVTAVSAWALRTQRLLPRWTIIALLFIGVVGLLIDGAIVYPAYLRP